MIIYNIHHHLRDPYKETCGKSIETNSDMYITPIEIENYQFEKLHIVTTRKRECVVVNVDIFYKGVHSECP
jgi:hypothetical protein